ncbi:hypothetical protein [Nonomuraea sp. NPDC050786]|uniref:alpha/beta hydrolase n=1 Tax=Nonomuraea sp. NPDC050786 TaxID=3154840 RepID=UPI0033C1C469
MRDLPSDLPEDPTSEQVNAWVELAELVGDDSFRQTVRRMVLSGEEDNRLEYGLNLRPLVLEHAGGALSRGIAPESPRTHLILERIMPDDLPAEETAALITWLEMVAEPRVERYWQLLSILKGQEFWNKVGQTRAADVSFVLDELTGAHPLWKGASLIAPSRIAMAGHSAGGASAIAAMLNDTRVRAGLNMDGTTFSPIPNSGLSRPFLFLGAQAMHSPGGKDTAWERDWAHLTGWKRWLVVTGAEHASFTDTALLVEQLGIYRNPGLSAERAVEITRGTVRAFLDLHLHHKPHPLLDKPSTRYPEVKRCDVVQKTCA